MLQNVAYIALVYVLCPFYGHRHILVIRILVCNNKTVVHSNYIFWIGSALYGARDPTVHPQHIFRKYS